MLTEGDEVSDRRALAGLAAAGAAGLLILALVTGGEDGAAPDPSPSASPSASGPPADPQLAAAEALLPPDAALLGLVDSGEITLRGLADRGNLDLCGAQVPLAARGRVVELRAQSATEFASVRVGADFQPSALTVGALRKLVEGQPERCAKDQTLPRVVFSQPELLAVLQEKPSPTLTIYVQRGRYLVVVERSSRNPLSPEALQETITFAQALPLAPPPPPAPSLPPSVPPPLPEPSAAVPEDVSPAPSS